jgi:hypothetical protein
MAFNELETKRYEKLLQEFIEQHGPQGHIRLKLRWGFKIEGQSVELLGIRPRWNDPTKKTSSGYAKAIYVKKDKFWKIYWMRADLRWHRFPPYPSAKTLEEFLAVVLADEHHCFFG